MSKGPTLFSGVSRNGKAILDNQHGYDFMLRALDGKRIAVSVQKEVKQRSLPQNGWYWTCLIPELAEHIGVDRKQLHEDLKRHFLEQELPNGWKTVGSTAKMNTVEYSRWMEDCQRLAAEYGCYVELPDEARTTSLLRSER